MTELLTAAQMRGTEMADINSGKVTGLELMERAGKGVVEAIFQEWPDLKSTSHRAVVLCGPGNNGGDGFVVARLLFDWGWNVDVYFFGEAEKLPTDARTNFDRWMERGPVNNLPKNSKSFETASIIVDALFGTGLTRGLPKDIANLAHDLSRRFVFKPSGEPDYLSDRVVAVDIPSGFCADSGTWLGEDAAFSAALTVTFQTAKPGHFLFLGPSNCGKLKIVPIGVDTRFSDANIFLTDVSNWKSKNLFLSKSLHTHKYNHGHALVLSGPAHKTGAARLSARGALRVGAGLVTIGSPKRALNENSAHLTAVMLTETDTPDQLSDVLEDPRINAVCVGPGMGVGEQTRQMVKSVLASGTTEIGRTVVLDADALTSFEANPDELFDLLTLNCVLTPHEGEFKRLFPDIAGKLKASSMTGPAYSKVDATCDAAERAGCIILFKGPDTVVADDEYRATINSGHYERAAPWLGTAGSGDVLAGFITGLAARGMSPMAAAETAAWLHVECALTFGPGLIAEDLPEQLPSVFRSLGI